MPPLDRSAPRLYVRGLFLGYKRSKANQHVNTALLKLEHVECTEDARWYLGKRVAYIYKAKTEKQGSKFRCIWGKVRARGCTVRIRSGRAGRERAHGGEGATAGCLTGPPRLSSSQVVRPHGTSGVVRAKFQKNLPPAAMGGKVRVMLYPSNI